jgi:hypothetical protein
VWHQFAHASVGCPVDPSDERLDGSTDALVGSGAAANLVARSGASYGAFGRPFPDVSGLRDE